MDKDVIYRQDAIDAIKNTYSLSYIEDGFNRQDAISILEQLPSAQPEIIRCGECKYMMADGRCYEFADDNIRPSASDFCSAGVRK